MAIVGTNRPFNSNGIRTLVLGPDLDVPTGGTLTAGTNNGALYVDGGTTLSATGGTIQVKGVATIGYGAVGTIQLTEHAVMSVSSLNLVSYYSGPISGDISFGTGSLLVDQSTLNVGFELRVGNLGTGSLTLRNAATVNTVDAYIGSGRSASASVDGPGTSLSVSNTLVVGGSGNGALTITNGATVSAAKIFFSYGYNGFTTTGTVSVRGPGSTLSASTGIGIATAPKGVPIFGTLTVSDHATVTTPILTIARGSTKAVGSLTLSEGSALIVTDLAYIGDSPGGSATATLTDSFATIGNTLRVYPTPNTSLSLTRSTLTVGTPASPTATLDNAATLTLDDHSALTLHGTLSLTGTLTLDETSHFLWTPSPTTFDPLSTLRSLLHDARILSSTPTLLPAYQLQLSDSSNTQLVVHLTLPGDANVDGQVNADDYALVDRSFALSQTNALWIDGDFDYNGIITNQDYLLIDTTYAKAHGWPSVGSLLAQRQSQFGPEYVQQLLTSIPEPSLALSSILLPLSSFLLIRRRPTQVCHF